MDKTDFYVFKPVQSFKVQGSFILKKLLVNKIFFFDFRP